MADLLTMLLRLSAIGSVLAAVLFLVKPFFKNRISKAVAYYLWVIVLLRLCLPFGISLPVPAGWLTGAQITQAQPLNSENNGIALGGNQTDTNNTAPTANASGSAAPALSGSAGDAVTGSDVKNSAARPGIMQMLGQWLKDPALWLLIWMSGALLSLAWHSFGYIRFVGIIRRSAVQPEEADLAVFQEFRESDRVWLVRSSFVRTPMLLGLLRPVIAVPLVSYTSDGLADDLRDILRHELTHYRRGDLLYKWFAMLVTCLHWFNPLMYLVRREIDRACELSCDEAVIASLTTSQKQHYGETLMSLAVHQTYPLGILATTMCEDKARLKERLICIMGYKSKTRAAILLSIILLLGLMGCATVSGVREATAPTVTPAAVNSAEINPTGTGNVTLYEEYGLTVAIRNDIIDQLVITEPNSPDESRLISVYEKRSLEDARTDFGDDAGMGFIFSLARYTQAQYEQFLASDGSGQSFFAKDDTYYYGWFTATDVQFYRSDNDIDLESDDWKAWEALCDKCADIKTDFIARNHLTPYSDSEFWEKEFTWDGAHLFLSYYPYYAYPDTAGAQGFTWQDVAYTLVLSQPAAQGDQGIWCVERWYDENGSLYYVFPRDTAESAAEYYAALQSVADSGGDPALATPENAALAFAKDYFDHTAATKDSFRRIEGQVAGNVWCLSNQVLDDMGTLQASILDASGNSDDQEALEVPDYQTPFSTPTSLYAYIWLKAEAPDRITGGVVYCRNSDGSKTIAFYEQDRLLCINADGTEQWFKPAYPYSNSPYDGMLGRYEEFLHYYNQEPAHTYTEAEYNAATDAAYEFFAGTFRGCTLTSLTYDPERSYKASESYMQHGHGSINGVSIDNVIVIFGSFTTDGSQGTLNPNSTYHDYMFILIRDNADASWVVDDWGY
jgi:beta-lactamase regulating signal transducer with metallopeptidase domain